ncbi:MAG: hypothetical protein QOF85_1879 [Solirubrobacterales bacterium]|jgi:hypothetical protein|nr:hypothetical protein [Solirubrobacterales bacterium]
MNMLKKGPELKVPELKVPDFMLDIYYDLRERHLLPLVAILLVALVALPIMLSSGSDSGSSETESAIATPSTVAPASTLVVAKAAPGLRDYRHRLAGTPKDPFKQQYANSEGEGAGEGSPGGEEPATVEPGEPSEPTTEPAGTSPPNEGDGEPPEEGHIKFYSFAIDVRVVGVSSKKNKPEPSVRHNLPELTMLPSRDVPALTFMSVTKDEKRALMLVSDKVTGLFGDGVCVVGAAACQLLALEPGVPETVVYGADARTYRIELLKLRLLKTDKLDKAPLGKPKHGG